MLDELDKRIIVMMQEDFPLVAEPYGEIAQKLGISEDLLLERLKGYRQSGKIRKMGAVLRHREVGYTANALCAWIVPEERIEEVGKLLAQDTIISHLYARVSQPGWPYNFYTMLHAHSREDCKAVAQDIAERTGLQDYVMLFSTKEWKKMSMQYFKDSN